MRSSGPPSLIVGEAAKARLDSYSPPLLGFCYNGSMKREDIIATLKQNEAALRARGVAHAALFGSRARGDDSPNSDIDIMIEIAPDAPVDLFEYVAITQYLADLFPIRVDVADRSQLKPFVRPSAEKSAVYAF